MFPSRQIGNQALYGLFNVLKYHTQKVEIACDIPDTLGASSLFLLTEVYYLRFLIMNCEFEMESWKKKPTKMIPGEETSETAHNFCD